MRNLNAEKMENNVKHEGIVQSIEGLNVTVKMTVNSACAGCHAKSLCSAADSRDKVVVAQNVNGADFAIGETVTVQLRQTLAMKAVIICYLVPFIILFSSFCLMYAICPIEWVNVLVSLSLTALYYIILWFFRKKIEKNVTFVVNKTFQNI